MMSFMNKYLPVFRAYFYSVSGSGIRYRRHFISPLTNISTLSRMIIHQHLRSICPFFIKLCYDAQSYR